MKSFGFCRFSALQQQDSGHLSCPFFINFIFFEKDNKVIEKL